MRRALAVVCALALPACAELGGGELGSASVGKPNDGYLIAGAKMPDHGLGFTTRDVWRQRDARYGTDELIELITAVARRMHARAGDVELVIADLSQRHGGAGGAEFHRSHMNGRDCDLVYYARDAKGKPITPDAMRVFDRNGVATDGSGIALDVARNWLVVRDLITAPEANVQWIFMYEPFAQKLLAHAAKLGEPEAIIARARATLRQPGDSARHDDHMHVRVYCSAKDRARGCADMGPMERLDRTGIVVERPVPDVVLRELRRRYR